MKISEIRPEFEKIIEGCHKASQMKSEVFQKQTYEQWLERFFQLAKTQRAMYEENQIILYGIFEIFEENPVPEVAYEELLDCLKILNKPENEDPGLEEEMLQILIPHYEAEGNLEILLRLYLYAGYMYMELSRTGIKQYRDFSVSYFHKVLSHRYEMDLMKNKKCIACVILCYRNLILASASFKNISLGDALQLWKECKEYIENPEVYEILKQNAYALKQAKYTLRAFEKWAFYLYQENHCKEKTIYPILLDLAKNIYIDQEFPIEDLENPLKIDRYLYHSIRYEYHLDSAEEAFLEMNQFYEDHFTLEFDEINQTDDPVSLLINPYMLMIMMLHRTEYSWDEKHEYVLKYCNDVVEVAKNYRVSLHSYTMNHALAEIAKCELFFYYLEPQEKLDFLIQLTVSRQISTMIHSHMVSKISSLILSHIIEEEPKLLVGCIGLSDTKMVREQKGELLRYIHNAAMVHDIGKNTMIDIILTSHRKLTDTEYKIIQEHPENGCMLLFADPSFEIYFDVVMGHHRFYDGTKGYNKNYDNVESSYRFLVDLITVADCIDAATDYLGRNFRKAKKFSEVFAELQDGKGTRYNQDIINFIEQDHKLRSDLEYISENGRTLIYYDIYQSYI